MHAHCLVKISSSPPLSSPPLRFKTEQNLAINKTIVRSLETIRHWWIWYGTNILKVLGKMGSPFLILYETIDGCDSIEIQWIIARMRSVIEATTWFKLAICTCFDDVIPQCTSNILHSSHAEEIIIVWNSYHYTTH